MKTIKEILELPLPAFKAAYAIAQEAHKNQKRKDGKPYMTHIDAVVENTYKLLYEEYIAEFLDETIKTRTDQNEITDVAAYLIVAAQHDLYEDNKLYDVDQTIDELMVVWPEKYSYRIPHIKTALHRISKQEHGAKTYERYSEYVARVRKSKYSRIAKIADLLHNMSDLTPGNMYDKYDLTLAFLEDEI